MTAVARLTRHTDLAAAAAIVLVVVMLVIPLPAALLDVLIALNIAAGLVILLTAIYVLEPLEISAFPSLLLVTTLFRLAINVSVTRLVLLHGDAGSVISAFGGFVVGGNLVVGLVVFLILVVIQFVVITAGATRVAEVAARFTLDAIPGKQMAIDVDLNSGQITEEDARRRRTNLEREADFYGAMDGASKFVKGDAIAAVVIVAINLLGGITIGVLQNGLSIGEAVHVYSILTIGDGLAAQVPALLVSTATGIIVTRAASNVPLARELTSQLGAQAQPLLVAGAALLGLALVPGLPKLPFFALAAVLVGAGLVVRRRTQATAAVPAEEIADPDSSPAGVRGLLGVDLLELAVGYGLVPLVDESADGELLGRVGLIRRNVAGELGIVLPPVRVRDNIELDATEYAIKIKGETVAAGELRPGYLLALDPSGEAPELPGTPTVEPAFGLPATWIAEQHREQALALGYTVVDPAAQAATHLSQVIKEHADELLTRDAVKELLDDLKETQPAAVGELVPDMLSTGEVQRVLQLLLREGVPIRDLGTICETIADAARHTKDTALLADAARVALGRTIAKPHLGRDRTLAALVLSPSLEQELADSVSHTSQGQVFALPPQRAHAVLQAARDALEEAQATDANAVVICSGTIRRHVHALLRQVAPRLAVLAYQEVPPAANVQTVGVISA
ncbi:FlhA: flagellar biosynthesis protein FlhA [Gaiella occulta]|uniref:Flagellar biosynthesis protein FlhA n=1 Tax=Gaiella occulta TaxID=1002870 RepID=A0A7M2Z1K2_9ACTN|nr:flagellar biosynthesis protein FlhA [Gaiella occulta]RDI75999.1 FlhA: flagellar biosynthesis protein FlhA [Gaiella occulta]